MALTLAMVTFDTTDADFLAVFERAAFPAPQWTHEAHARMAWLYLRRLGPDAALDAVRAGINALNNAHIRAGFKPSVGYHETITAAWLRLLAGAVAADGGPRDEPWAEFKLRHPGLLDSRALLRHYSRERLMSPDARAAFVAPDLEPLP